MLHRCNKASGIAVFLTLVLLAGCSGSDDWEKPGSENQGYQWRGEGEPGNFGSAYGFCRSTLGQETLGQRLEGGAGLATGIPGGPVTIPGYERNTQATRTYAANRRQFTDCMASQGWVTAEPEPTPKQV
jgi:hypothetical protein